MMTSRPLFFLIGLIISLFFFVACGSTDTTLPTVRPTLDSSPPTETVDPNLGSGFDPDLGNDDPATEAIATPTRENSSGVAGDTESGARGTGFMAQIVGGSVNNITDGGQYACNVAGHRIASGDNPAPNITFTLPTSDDEGTYTFPASNATVTVQISLESVEDNYNQVVDGTVVIDELPTQAGEFASGNFNITVRNDSGDEIGVQGDFDFESGESAYCS